MERETLDTVKKLKFISRALVKSKENKYIAACFFKVKESHNLNLEAQRDWHLLCSYWTVEIG